MMTAELVISANVKEELLKFLKSNKKPDLLTTYLYYVQKKFDIQPVLFIREKTIYKSQRDLIAMLEQQGKLWRETEIKIQFGQKNVNDETQRVYICPYSGKVFGDNTHPNPQDAIYEWVSTCPENTDRKGGLKVKKFFVSEDPEVIKNYIEKRKEPIKKIVYSSAVTGKLFNSKKTVIDDFKKHQLKPMALYTVPTQNRFQIEDSFMQFIQEQVEDSNLSAFVEAIGQDPAFGSYVEHWFEEEE